MLAPSTVNNADGVFTLQEAIATFGRDQIEQCLEKTRQEWTVGADILMFLPTPKDWVFFVLRSDELITGTLDGLLLIVRKSRIIQSFAAMEDSVPNEHSDAELIPEICPQSQHDGLNDSYFISPPRISELPVPRELCLKFIQSATIEDFAYVAFGKLNPVQITEAIREHEVEDTVSV